MKKILVLGKKGMLGHLLYDYLLGTRKYEVIGFEKNSLDALKSKKEIEKIISKHSPDYVINCIGLINIYANKDKEMAEKINAIFPKILADLGIKNNWKLIHISSDCYLDDDIYGKSKRLGEINDSHNLTIRTSIIGPELKEGFGLFHWFMAQKESVDGYIKAYWDGVTTLQLSKFIEEQIDSDKYTEIIDYRTKEYIDKYHLIKLIADIFNKKIEIKKDYREIKDKRNLQADVFCFKTYSQQIKELKDYMEKNKKKYAKYLYEKND